MRERHTRSKPGHINGMRHERQEYLTKRILVRSAKRAFKEAAEETMDVLGYNVVAKNGWIVKICADGSEEKISEIQRIKRPRVIFD